MNTGLLKFFVDYGLFDYAMYAMGLFGLFLIVERSKALFFDYTIKADAFIAQVKSLVEADKIEEAVAFCTANQAKPLAYVIKRVLERADRDDASIDQAVDIASSEVAPNIGKRLTYLSMVANVATLLGLLGTVAGLIMSFQAVSFADPSQKQLLLAQGISMAMHATAMGLIIAIPTMVVYSFLHAKQGRIFSEIDRFSTIVIDLLHSRGYQPFTEGAAFPQHVGEPANIAGNGAMKAPPPPAMKQAKIS